MILDGKGDCIDRSDEIQNYHISRKCIMAGYYCNELVCIPSVKVKPVCDGEVNTWSGCYDVSDEADCQAWECQPGYWRCKDNLFCVRIKTIMDGRADCEDGSDENKTNHAVRSCLSGQYQCDNFQCIERSHVCDGRNFMVDLTAIHDCFDGSDEANCEEWECNPGFWKCADNLQCIRAAAVCNRHLGCLDGSDEDNKLCGCEQENDWPCVDGNGCTHRSEVCDGHAHCMDNSDENETTCITWNCTIGQWKCHNSFQCIGILQLCDGKPDCIDLSDEVKNICPKYKCTFGYSKCADKLQCISNDHICDDKVHCLDGSDELCASSCLKATSTVKSIIKRCSGQSDLCLPVYQFCDGVADCPDGSDEADSGCSCKDWGLVPCHINGTLLCTHPRWIEVNMMREGVNFCGKAVLFDKEQATDADNICRYIGDNECVIILADGEDDTSCLNKASSRHCNTLEYALNHNARRVCLQGKFVNTFQNITLNNKCKNIVDILCRNCIMENLTLIISNAGETIVEVSIIDLVSIRSSFAFRNVKVSFESSFLSNTFLTNIDTTVYFPDYCEIIFENSLMVCNSSFPVKCGLYYVENSFVKLVSQTSTFRFCTIDITVLGIALSFHKTDLMDTRVTLRTHSYLPVPAFIHFTEVNISDTSNEIAQTNEIILLFQNPAIFIERSDFEMKQITLKSEKDIYPVHFFLLKIIGSAFIKANKRGKGGAVFVSSDFKGSEVYFTQCSFVENMVQKENNGILAFGGAVYVEGINVRLNIAHSFFLNNFAPDSGTALYTSLGVSVSIVNSSFHYDITEGARTLTTMFSVAGLLDSLDGSFSITNYYPQLYKQNLEVLSIARAVTFDVHINCPYWHEHITKYSVSSYNLQSNLSQSITGLSYFCHPCPESHYTTADSHQQFTNRYPFSGRVKAKEKTCLPCPHGAICSGNNVIPRANYWGYWHNGELKFARCPPKYCCLGGSKETCKKYNYCADHRTGILCGVCKKGYSISILTGLCFPDSKCGKDHWFWLFAFLGTMVYAMWYTFLGNIFEPIFNLFFVRNCKKSIKGTSKVAEAILKIDVATVHSGSLHESLKKGLFTYANHSQHSKPIDASQQVEISNLPKDKGSSRGTDKNKTYSLNLIKTSQAVNKGYFAIFNNFIQMAMAMKIQIEYASGTSQKSNLDSMMEIMHGFFSLNIQMASIDICPIKDLTSFGRHMYNLIFTLGIYSSWLFIFLFIIFLSSVLETMATLCNSKFCLDLFRQKLVKGLIRIVKFTYSTLCGIIFMSIICVPIGSKRVWWYDSTNICFETWQIIMIVFGILYAIPFPFVLFVGMKLLSSKKIDAPLFVAFCLCPGAAMCYLMVSKIFKNATVIEKSSESETTSTKTILSVLQGPYRKDNESLAIYWEAMVFLRRLLTTLVKLVGSEFVQLLILTLMWMIFLVQHIYMSPFEVRSSNHVETLSLFLLVIVAIINLIKAFLTDSGFILSGPTVPMVQGLEFTEQMTVVLLLVYIAATEFKLRRKEKQNDIPG